MYQPYKDLTLHWLVKVSAYKRTYPCSGQYVGHTPLVIKIAGPDSNLCSVCYLISSQAGRTKVMADAGYYILQPLKSKFCPAKISEWAIRSSAVGRLIVKPMVFGPMSSRGGQNSQTCPQKYVGSLI